MTLITPDVKFADAIHCNYLLIPVINRFGIRFGFGEKTVEEVCAEYKIDTAFFIAILNTFTFESYFSSKKLQVFSPLQWVDYLRKTHAYYREVQLPVIALHINRLIGGITSGDTKNLALIGKFFDSYKSELLSHLGKEENSTFPYVEQLVQIQQNGKNKHQEFVELSKRYSIKVYEREHDNVDEKLFDLKNILLKYLSGNYDQTLCNAVIFELSRLEGDLQDHTRLEDKVLIPMVKAIEDELNKP